jgi:hypothetical protein
MWVVVSQHIPPNHILPRVRFRGQIMTDRYPQAGIVELEMLNRIARYHRVHGTQHCNDSILLGKHRWSSLLL